MSDEGVPTTGAAGVSQSAGEPALHEGTLAATARLAVRVAGALTFAALLIALVTRLYFAIQARRWLAYPFTGVPPTPGVAAAIFADNLRALLTVGGALLIVQIPRWEQSASGGTPWGLRLAVDFVLGVAVLANLVVVGVSFGAYGPRMVTASLPHGPVEVASYSLALALYVQGRHRRLPVSHILKVGALSVALLALAAALETFVNV